MEKSLECGFDWLKGNDMATFTFPAGTRMANRLIRLAQDYPDECQITDRNRDGSITGHVPVRWIKVSPPRKMSEEEKKELTERLRRSGTPRGQGSN